MGDRRRVVAVALAVAILAALVVVGHHVWQERHRSDLSRALDVVPQETQRIGFTDWSQVRAGLKLNLGSDPSPSAVESMISKAYDADLSSVSSIDDSAVALQTHFGFSPATATWEAYAQADAGDVMVLRMPDGFDFGRVTGDLTDLGFTKPSQATGVWVGGIDLVSAIDPTITPELQYVAVLADKHLVISSDDQSYAEKAVSVALGKAKSLGDVQSVRDVVAPLDEPASATVWARDYACNDLTMGQAAQDDQDQADALIAKAGKITPLAGLVIAMDKDRSIAVSELFEDKQSAKENLQARARLIVGEAPGRGGSFSDDLTLRSSRTDGATVQLRLTPKESTGFVISAIDTGPVLFATC